MSPALLPGDIVLALGKVPKPGDIVIARVRDREVIKRVDHIEKGRLFLLGDNPPVSTDSRHFGSVVESDILGVVVMKLRFAHTTSAPKPSSKQLSVVPFALAFAVVVMLLSQLFFFEDFVSFFVANGSVDVYDKTKASFIVLAELLSLPFWLQMRLSPLARGVSAFLGLVFPLQWLLIAAMAHIGAVPYFGTLMTFSNDMDLLWGGVLVLASLTSFYILRGTTLFKDIKSK